VAYGSSFGEHSLYLKNNGQRYAYNFVGSFEQKAVATEDRPTAENLAASFDKDGQDSPGVAAGILSAVRTIWHNT
jgi:hypothetical protein